MGVSVLECGRWLRRVIEALTRLRFGIQLQTRVLGLSVPLQFLLSRLSLKDSGWSCGGLNSDFGFGVKDCR